MKCIGVIGASSLVGRRVLTELSYVDVQVYAFSRSEPELSNGNIQWVQISSTTQALKITISHWICAAPIWVLPEYLQMLETYGVQRIVALSSTSAVSKQNSSDTLEVNTAKRLQSSEKELKLWAEKKNINWIILRPTLIYGFNKDKNIAEITRFIKRFGFFPLLGQAKGLRMPVHANDVATACILSIQHPKVSNYIYNISGAETLSYKEMVKRIFITLEKKPRFISIPLNLFKVAVFCLRIFPRYRNWSPAMAERMNNDLTFDHTDASLHFGYRPKSFDLS